MHDPRRRRGILDVCCRHSLPHLPLPGHWAWRGRRLGRGLWTGAGHSYGARRQAIICPRPRLVLSPGERLLVLCPLGVVEIRHHPRKSKVWFSGNLDALARAPCTIMRKFVSAHAPFHHLELIAWQAAVLPGLWPDAASSSPGKSHLTPSIALPLIRMGTSLCAQLEIEREDNVNL